MKSLFSKNRGFTLIELLVVISIISLLSSIVLASLNSARMKARDVRRIQDLIQIRNALEQYADDHNGKYPDADCGYNCNGYRYGYTSGWDALAVDLRPYMGSLPKDPINSSCPPWTDGCYSYAYGNPGTYYNLSPGVKTSDGAPQYDLTAQLEDPNSPYRCAVKNYVWFFNAQAWCSAGGYSGQIYEASIK